MGNRTYPSVSIVIPTFRDQRRAIALVHALNDLPAIARSRREIIVVDDGSGHGSAEELSRELGTMAQVIALPFNVGRSAARNAGAKSASGELILFMDCDCLPASGEMLRSHLECWGDGVVATIGPVVGDGRGFWHRYQTGASDRRRRQHAEGLVCSGSSQNMMVRRSAFEACGGFDTDYRTYGFEDRDLQIRLSRLGTIRWAEGAVVQHMDHLSLQAVARKMAEAGGDAATLFRARHPDEYRRLGYSTLDAHLHPWLRLPAMLAATCVPAIARLADHVLHKSWLPYPIKRFLVQSTTAASYLSGCRPR